MEPELKTTMTSSEETVSQYAAKENIRNQRSKVKKQSQAPGEVSLNKDKSAAGPQSLHESGQRPVPLSEQFMYDKKPTVKEKRTEVQEVPEKDIILKSVPSPAGLSAPEGLKQEYAPQAAGKIISRLSDKEDISLSFKVRDIDSAKRDIAEVFSDLGGKVVREEPTSDAFIILGELGSDNLLLFMKKLKTLGYVKERTPTPMSDKDRVLIKITVSGN
jgi:hypothetical protein